MHELLITGIEKTLGEKIPLEMISSLEAFSFEKTFEKKSLLAEAGKPCNYQYFVLEGSCYSYYLNEKGYKNVIELSIEGYWITDMQFLITYFREIIISDRGT